MKKILLYICCWISFACNVSANEYLSADFWKTATIKETQNFIKYNDVNAKDKYGNTVLMYASAYNENPLVIRELIQAGADVRARDKKRRMVLTWAVRYNNNPKVIDELFKAGADKEIKNKFDGTLLYLSSQQNKNPEILEAIFKGLDNSAKD